MSPKSILSRGPILAVAVVSLSITLPAQNPMSLVTHVQAKPEGSSTLADLVRAHMVPGYEKSGTVLHTWRVPSLGKHHRYMLVEPIQSLSVLDKTPPWMEAIGPTRAQRFFRQVHRHALTVGGEVYVGRPDLSYLPRGKFDFKLAMLVEVVAKVGVGSRIEEMLRTEIVPAYKAMKRGFATNQVSIGGNTNQWVFFVELEKMADLDGGPFLAREWGPEQFGQWTQSLSELFTHESQQSVAELIPDLSVMGE